MLVLYPIDPLEPGRPDDSYAAEADVYFNDQDECIQDVPETTTVFKVRNGGNFDFEGRKWLSTAKLTRLLWPRRHGKKARTGRVTGQAASVGRKMKEEGTTPR